MLIKIFMKFLMKHKYIFPNTHKNFKNNEFDIFFVCYFLNIIFLNQNVFFNFFINNFKKFYNLHFYTIFIILMNKEYIVNVSNNFISINMICYTYKFHFYIKKI